MDSTPISHVSDTAFWIAHLRAKESGRPDALFRDPLAGRLAGERGRRIAKEMRRGYFTEWMTVVRTVIIDGYIRSAVEKGVDTVLNLGAGLDTRPYRMELPESLRWIEADYPDVMEYKERELAGEKPRCRLERAKLDLADPAARGAFLASVDVDSRKTLVLTEGVVSYLENRDVAALAEDLRARPHIRYWVTEYFSPVTVKYRRRATQSSLRNAPFKFDPGGDWFGFFRERGWRAADIQYLVVEGHKLKRSFPFPLWMKLFIRVRRLFSPGARKDDFRKFWGYVLLEPAEEDGAVAADNAGNSP